MYAMQAAFHKSLNIPVVFHFRRIDHQPTQQDLDEFRKDLEENYGCADLMEYIKVKDATNRLAMYEGSPEFTGVYHSDPHDMYDPEVPPGEWCDNHAAGEY